VQLKVAIGSFREGRAFCAIRSRVLFGVAFRDLPINAYRDPETVSSTNEKSPMCASKPSPCLETSIGLNSTADSDKPSVQVHGAMDEALLLLRRYQSSPRTPPHYLVPT
jgi:hypothetical protein